MDKKFIGDMTNHDDGEKAQAYILKGREHVVGKYQWADGANIIYPSEKKSAELKEVCLHLTEDAASTAKFLQSGVNPVLDYKNYNELIMASLGLGKGHDVIGGYTICALCLDKAIFSLREMIDRIETIKAIVSDINK